MDKDRNNAIALVGGAVFVLLMSCCSGLVAITGGEGNEMASGILFGLVSLVELALAFVMVRRARALWTGRASEADPEVK